jgi:hypothetical protein
MKVATNRKLLHYSIFLYVSLLVIEIIAVVSAKTGEFREGKVFSALSGQAENIMASSWPAIAWYLFALTMVYLLAAWANYGIAAAVSARIKKGQTAETSAFFSFAAVNAIFILSLYVLNSFLYPHSLHSLDFISKKSLLTYDQAVIIFHLFILLYLAILLASIRKRKIVFLLLTFALFSLSFNYAPGLLANYGYSRSENTNREPNVIIIGIDSLRPDYLSYYNEQAPATPNADRFFAESIVFTNAYTPLARTYPSWVSILSGAYPARTGARYNLINDSRLGESAFSLNKLLQEQYGYTTIHAMDETRFCNISHEDGFDKLIHPVTGATDFLLGSFHDFPLANLLLNNRTGSLFFPFLNRNRAVSHLYTGAEFTEDVLLSIAKLRKTEKFLLAVHLCYPHWPYHSAFSPRQEANRQADAAYRQSLEKADEQLGVILNALKQRKLFDQSIVIVLSDHGESFGAHWGHGTSLYDDSQNHIVLAVKPPDHQTHAVIDDLVSTVDIAPTILDLLGIPRSRERMDGRTLLTPRETNDERTIFLETGLNLFHPSGTALSLDEMIRAGAEYYEVSPTSGLISVKSKFHDQVLANKQFGAQRGNWRLIVQRTRGDRWSADLFDLAADPLMANDLSPGQPALFASLLAELNDHFGLSLAAPELEHKGKGK